MVSNESPHNGHDVTKIIVEIAETKDVDPIDLDPLFTKALTLTRSTPYLRRDSPEQSNLAMPVVQ